MFGKNHFIKKKPTKTCRHHRRVVWVPGKVEHILPSALVMCFHDRSPSSVGGIVQIKSSFEALWAWEVGCTGLMVNKPP